MSSDVWIDDETAQWELAAPDADDELVATVVQYDDVPDECTIHPLNPTEEDVMTRWITALEDSFVSLPDVR